MRAGTSGESARGMAARQGRDATRLDAKRYSPTRTGRALPRQVLIPCSEWGFVSRWIRPP